MKNTGLFKASSVDHQSVVYRQVVPHGTELTNVQQYPFSSTEEPSRHGLV